MQGQKSFFLIFLKTRHQWRRARLRIVSIMSGRKGAGNFCIIRINADHALRQAERNAPKNFFRWTSSVIRSGCRCKPIRKNGLKHGILKMTESRAKLLYSAISEEGQRAAMLAERDFALLNPFRIILKTKAGNSRFFGSGYFWRLNLPFSGIFLKSLICCRVLGQRPIVQMRNQLGPENIQ